MEESIRVRLSSTDAAALKAAAESARISVSAMVRLALFDHTLIRRELEPLKQSSPADVTA
jgi:hypothetical protein